MTRSVVATSIIFVLMLGITGVIACFASQPTEYRVVYTTGYDAGMICYQDGDQFLWYAQEHNGLLINPWKSVGICNAEKSTVEERLAELKINLDKSKLSKEA